MFTPCNFHGDERVSEEGSCYTVKALQCATKDRREASHKGKGKEQLMEARKTSDSKSDNEKN